MALLFSEIRLGEFGDDLLPDGPRGDEGHELSDSEAFATVGLALFVLVVGETAMGRFTADDDDDVVAIVVVVVGAMSSLLMWL